MNKIIPALLGLGLAGFLAAGCGTAAALYVSASDPVLTACQTSDVQNIATLDQSVDDANNTAGGINGDGTGTALDNSQAAGLRHAAATYRTLATQVSGHPAFATTLLNEAQEFTVAAAAPDGLTTNSVATAADQFASQIQADCGAFRVGTAPKYTKPGPGIWNWGLFWVVTTGYLAMSLVGSVLIATAQRNKPRKERYSPGQIFWLSLVWWVSIFAALGGTYKHAISSLTLTRDEKKDDRIAALAKENARLEAQLAKPIKP